MAKSKTTKKQSITDKEQQKWLAESDAYTLAEAEAIKMDRGRFSRAKRVASKLAKEAEKKAN